jgi:hypothetical protein
MENGVATLNDYQVYQLAAGRNYDAKACGSNLCVAICASRKYDVLLRYIITGTNMNKVFESRVADGDKSE